MCTKYPHGRDGQEDGLGEKSNEEQTESAQFIHPIHNSNRSNHVFKFTKLSLHVASFWTLSKNNYRFFFQKG
jgi:hypothetical protein